MSDSSQPNVTVTQPKVAFLLSLLAIGGVVYGFTDKVVRHQVEFDSLKNSYVQLEIGQKALRGEVKSLRDTIDNEIRHMANAIDRLSVSINTSTTGDN